MGLSTYKPAKNLFFAGYWYRRLAMIELFSCETSLAISKWKHFKRLPSKHQVSSWSPDSLFESAGREANGISVKNHPATPWLAGGLEHFLFSISYMG